MSIRENVSIALRRYKAANRLSLVELSDALDIPSSSLQSYLKAQRDLRSDTIELLAKKTGTPLMEMVSGPAPEWEQAETIVRAARKLGGLSEERQEQGIQLFLQLVALFAGDT